MCVVVRLRGLYKGQWLFLSRNRLRGKCEVMRQVSVACKGLMTERCKSGKSKTIIEVWCFFFFWGGGCTYGNRVVSRSVQSLRTKLLFQAVFMDDCMKSVFFVDSRYWS